MSFGFDIKSQKILGRLDPQEGKWSIAFEYDPDEANLLESRGKLFLVVDFEGSAGIDLHLASKILIDSIREHYYGDLEGTPLQALEAALVFGKDRLVEVINKEGVLGLSFNIASCVVWSSILYVAQVGSTSCLIIRNGETVDISHKTSGEVMTSSGILETEDVVIIASKKFSEEFNNEDLSINLTNIDKKFNDSPNSALLAAVIIRFKKNSMPGKKDLAGLVNFVKFKKKKPENKDVDVISAPSTSKQVVNDSVVITSLVDTENNNEMFSKPSESLSANLLSDTKSIEEPEEDLKQSTEINPTLKKEGKKRGRKTKHLVTGLFILLILGVFGYTAYSFYTGNKTKDTPVSYVSTEIDKYTKEFNEIGANKGTLQAYKDLLSKIENDTNSKTGDYENLIDKVNAQILKIQEASRKLDDFLVYDFSKDNPKTLLNKVTDNGKSYLISDKGNNTSYLLQDLEKPEPQSYALTQEYLSSFIDNETMYFVEKNRVYLGDDIKKLTESAFDKPVQGAKDIFVYFDNVYVLDEKGVLKLTADNTNYVLSTWKELESNPVSLAIDGSIYISEKNKITKYFKGEQVDFALDESVINELDNALIYTTVDFKSLYVLTNQKLFTVSKESGKVLSTLDLESFETINSFTVADNTLYLVTNSALYGIKLTNE